MKKNFYDLAFPVSDIVHSMFILSRKYRRNWTSKTELTASGTDGDTDGCKLKRPASTSREFIHMASCEGTAFARDLVYACTGDQIPFASFLDS